jgi:hypothetical protein
MTKSNFDNVISADGTYVFPQPSVSKFGVLQIAGGFGDGTVALGYDDGSGNFVAARNFSGDAITTAVADSYHVTMPVSGKLAIGVTGSTTPTLVVSFKPLEED